MNDVTSLQLIIGREDENEYIEIDLNEYNEKYKQLKSRIDKAIEYIEQEVNNCDIYCDGCTPQHCPDIKKILDILKGGENEKSNNA